MAEDTGTGGGPVVVREIYRGQPPGEVVSGAASVKSTRITASGDLSLMAMGVAGHLPGGTP